MNILAVIQALFAALNPAAHNSLTTLLQDALNILGELGVIALPAPLVVDGQFGLTTFAAFKLLQNRVGLSFMSTEPFATIEYNLLNGFLGSQAAVAAKLGKKIR